MTCGPHINAIQAGRGEIGTERDRDVAIAAAQRDQGDADRRRR